MIMELKILTTGGTIDKDYASGKGIYNFEISSPAIEAILNRADPNFDYEIESILKKDSLDMDEQDRQKIFEACQNEKTNKIIITHGTDTMVETAKKISSIKNKAIVLVGASKPTKFHDSDAHFNVGTAIGALNLIKEGVYVAMNGRIYPWNNVAKNAKDGVFQQLR
jgi:L-asparaginase